MNDKHKFFSWKSDFHFWIIKCTAVSVPLREGIILKSNNPRNLWPFRFTYVWWFPDRENRQFTAVFVFWTWVFQMLSSDSKFYHEHHIQCRLNEDLRVDRVGTSKEFLLKEVHLMGQRWNSKESKVSPKNSYGVYFAFPILSANKTDIYQRRKVHQTLANDNSIQ